MTADAADARARDLPFRDCPKVPRSTVAINLRSVEKTMGERLLAVGEAEARKSGGFFRGPSTSRDAQRGIASEAIEKPSREMFHNFLADGFTDALLAPALN